MDCIEIPQGWAAEVLTWRRDNDLVARMELHYAGDLLAVFLVSGAPDIPRLSAKLWERAAEVIERRGICRRPRPAAGETC